MKTKKYLKSKVSSYCEDDIVYIIKPDYLTYLVKYPYRKQFHYNALYWFLCSLLIPNSNLLGNVWKYEQEGVLEPLKREVLGSMTAMPKHTFSTMLAKLVADGILLRITLGRDNVYYINPYFAIAGDSVPKFLVDFVEYNDGRVLGQYLFPKDNELYKDNRNEGNRFGDFTKKVRSKYFSTTAGRRE